MWAIKKAQHLWYLIKNRNIMNPRKIGLCKKGSALFILVAPGEKVMTGDTWRIRMYYWGGKWPPLKANFKIEETVRETYLCFTINDVMKGVVATTLVLYMFHDVEEICYWSEDEQCCRSTVLELCLLKHKVHLMSFKIRARGPMTHLHCNTLLTLSPMLSTSNFSVNRRLRETTETTPSYVWIWSISKYLMLTINTFK